MGAKTAAPARPGGMGCKDGKACIRSGPVTGTKQGGRILSDDVSGGGILCSIFNGIGIVAGAIGRWHSRLSIDLRMSNSRFSGESVGGSTYPRVCASYINKSKSRSAVQKQRKCLPFLEQAVSKLGRCSTSPTDDDEFEANYCCCGITQEETAGRKN